MGDANTVILSIDIGSTRSHVAAVDVVGLSCVGRVDFDNADFDGRFVPAVKKILSANPRIRGVNVSSCVRALAEKAEHYCGRENLPDGIALVKADNNQSIQFNYEDAAKLGTDRVCNALACAALFKGRGCVIIDSGTAITIDYLRAGKFFEGGAILPGCAMQADALHNRTDALPRVNLYRAGIDSPVISHVNSCETNKNFADDNKSPVTFPSKSTENCIKSGILYGTAGAVERCVAEYRKIINYNNAIVDGDNGNNGDNVSDDNNCGNYGLLIVATGGGWELIRPLVVSCDVTTVPDLTLIGAALYC